MFGTGYVRRVREEAERTVLTKIQVSGNEVFNLGSAYKKSCIDVSSAAMEELTGLCDLFDVGGHRGREKFEIFPKFTILGMG